VNTTLSYIYARKKLECEEILKPLIIDYGAYKNIWEGGIA